MQFEIRGGIPVEVRAEDSGVRVVGYAAVFGESADIGGYFTEIIEPGAFTRAITRDDVPFLIEHEGLPLARNTVVGPMGLLTLNEDSHGLHIDALLDPTDPDVQRIVPKMRSGTLSKMSFAFSATKQSWDDTAVPSIRRVQEVILGDVSIVTNPAYTGTEIALRSAQEARNARQNHSAAALRLRMKQDLLARLG